MQTGIFGTLSTLSVDLPFETPEKKSEADKTNAEIAGTGFRVVRRAYDWAFTPHDAGPREKPVPLKSGDLVKIFKTVSQGDVEWQGTVDYDYSGYHHGLQKGLDPRAWSTMFHKAMPAKLVRGDLVIYGALEPFCETGTEGVMWSIMEYGKSGYDALNGVENGDSLTVYSRVIDGEVEWEGLVDFGPTEIGKIDWTEIMRQTNHMKTEDWLHLTYQARPVIVTPAP